MLIHTLALACSIVCAFGTQSQVEAKRSRITCAQDECSLPPQHLTLYSNIKQAVDGGFDLNGKEVVPLLRSIQVLRLRYANEDQVLNSSKLINSLLRDEALERAIKLFESDAGRALVDFYRSPVNGKSQNLACGQWRIEGIERAKRRLDSDKQLAEVFSKIHSNFAKKSARKCLKSSCNSVDVFMSKLDSIPRRSQRKPATSDPDFIPQDDNKTDDLIERREFESEEQELCRFLKRTNESDCRISGNDMLEISFIPAKGDSLANATSEVSFKDYLRSYNSYRSTGTSPTIGDVADSGKQVDEQTNLLDAGKSILSQCRPMKELLTYNLAAIRWYRDNQLLDQEKFKSRTIWCPNLAYWLQVDRLCKEIEVAMSDLSSVGTFRYEVASSSGNSI